MKMFAKILCLIMALAMMVSCFAACGDDKKEETKDGASVSDKEDKNDKEEEDEDEDEKPSKKPSSDDPEDLIIGEWSGKADIGTASGAGFKFNSKISVEFKKNGEFVIKYDEDDFMEYTIKYYELQMEEGGKTEEDFEEEYGMSLEEYIEENFNADACVVEGEYEFDGDELFMNGEEEEYEFKDEDNLVLIENGTKIKLKRD